MTDGFGLSGLGTKNGLIVFYESISSAFTPGTLNAYLYEQELSNRAGAWVRVSALDLSVQALTAQVFIVRTGLRGRIAFVPSGTGRPGVVWILGSASRA